MNTLHPSCISCGMPLRSAAEHALGDVAKPYCVHCSDTRGELKTYDAVLSGLTGFLIKTQEW